MKRTGFTLIELIVVVAIMIILVSIAIPVYAKLINRAKRSRVLGYFSTLQNSLEAYRTDWGTYPVTGSGGETFGYHTDYNAVTSHIAKELIGDGATLNVPSNTTTLGEAGGIDYFTGKWIIRRMRNLFDPAKDCEYYSEDGTAYILACEYKEDNVMHYILKGSGIDYKDVIVKPSWYTDQ